MVARHARADRERCGGNEAVRLREGPAAGGVGAAPLARLPTFPVVQRHDPEAGKELPRNSALGATPSPAAQARHAASIAGPRAEPGLAPCPKVHY